MRKFHLSYDTIDCERDFKTYNQARRYLLCVLGSIPSMNLINSYTESSIIIELEILNTQRLFNFLRNNLQPYFYYSVSLVAKNNTTGYEYISHHPNIILDRRLQRELARLSCDNLGKQIVNY